MPQLTDLRARRVAPGDKPIADGKIPGLRLEPGATKGEGKWILRFVSPASGKRRDMGLGAYPDTGIAEARGRGSEARKLIGRGQDPIEAREADRVARKAVSEAMTFERAAVSVHEDQRLGWKNSKHADQWINTLREYAFPMVGRRRVADLAANDFAAVLRPIWLSKPETASRVKQRCHTIMKWCWARQLIVANPVDVVDYLLPPQPGKRERTVHQPSMPWRAMPAFLSEHLYAGVPNVTKLLLEFVILTAARSGEARAMHWDEIDLDVGVWTVPASRMKAKLLHRVPLSHRTIEILRFQRTRHPNDLLVFPSPRGVVLSDMVLTKFLRDHKAQSSEAGRIATAHGFRSSFRDWASESSFARDLAERALSHTIKNHAEAAYHRTDLLEQRRPMMEAWADHVCSLHPVSSVTITHEFRGCL